MQRIARQDRSKIPMGELSRGKRRAGGSSSSQDLVESWLKESAADTQVCTESEGNSAFECESSASCETPAGGAVGDGARGRGRGEEGGAGVPRDVTIRSNSSDGGGGKSATHLKGSQVVGGGGETRTTDEEVPLRKVRLAKSPGALDEGKQKGAPALDRIEEDFLSESSDRQDSARDGLLCDVVGGLLCWLAACGRQPTLTEIFCLCPPVTTPHFRRPNSQKMTMLMLRTRVGPLAAQTAADPTPI